MLSTFTSLPSYLLFSSFLAAALPVSSSSTDLQELTSSNFSTSTRGGVWFIEYYSPWCHHCQNFAPIWKELVEYVGSQGHLDINLAQVNCLAQGDLCNSNEIKAYPTLKLYKDGKELEVFQRKRELDSLKEYVLEHARSVSDAYAIPNPDGIVLSLDKNSFKDAIARGPTFVKFYAPWCGHCKKLAPTWVQFADQMKNKVTVAEVNCDEHSAICTSEKIRGYPTIFFYQHGLPLEYTKSRTLAHLEAFADTVLAPPLKTLSSSDLAPVLEEQDVLYLLVHEDLDSALRDNLEEASKPLHGTPNIYSIRSSSELLSSLSLPATQSLPVLVSLKDHSTVAFHTLPISSQMEVPYVSDWLLTHSLPISSELDADNFQRIMGPSPSRSSSRLVVLAALDPLDKAPTRLLKEIAQTWHRGALATGGRQVVFAWMDREKWASWLKSVYGLKKGTEPAVVIVDHGRLMYFDVSPTGDPIRLEASSVFSVLEAIEGGILRPKHSENIAERFARFINDWLISIQTTVANHPIRSVILVILTFIGIFIGLKRFIEVDARKSSAHPYHKPEARLD